MARSLFLALKVALGAASTKDFDGLEKFRDGRHDIVEPEYEFSVSFQWDPFLNATAWKDLRDGGALPIVSSGLWQMRYLEPEMGVKTFEASVRNLLNEWMVGFPDTMPSLLIMRLLSPVVPDKLNDSRRRETLLPESIRLYNQMLREISNFAPLSSGFLVSEGLHSVYKSLPDPGLHTNDGLHFSYSVVSKEVSVLLNRLCNSKLFEDESPRDSQTACCHSGPRLSLKNLAFLVVLLLYSLLSILWGKFFTRTTSSSRLAALLDDWILSSSLSQNLLLLTTTLALMTVADRSPVFIKVDKVFLWWPFVILVALCLVAGLGTLTVEKDASFLNRYQTDEWKGWMQLFILIYHYTGASKVTVIYTLVRGLVAAYIFMTGYGHFVYFYKKEDFSISRVSKVLLRLNLLTIAMSYTMDQPLPFYYFSPLVSFWFLVIYSLMRAYNIQNGNHVFLFLKTLLWITTTTIIIRLPASISTLFRLVQQLFKTLDWDAEEFRFRLILDEWVVYLGIGMAWASIQINLHSMSIHVASSSLNSRLSGLRPANFKQFKFVVVNLSAIAIAAFLILSFLVQNKYLYNHHHPWLSLFPVAGFVIMRNSTDRLRRTSSKFWRWIGSFSLETFLLQYHLWLAADTKGILVLLPVAGLQPYSTLYWLNFVLTTVIFLGLSEMIARVTGELVNSLTLTRTGTCLCLLVLWNYL